MYVDKYSDRLSQEERALSEAAVAKKRKKQKLIFVVVSLAVAACLVLFIILFVSSIDNGHISKIAENNLDSGRRTNDRTTDGLLGFGQDTLWFLAGGIGIMAILGVSLKLNYDLLKTFNVVCVDKYKIISIKDNADDKYPYMLTANEYGRNKEKEFPISAATYDMIQDSKDVVIIYYPELKMFNKERNKTSPSFYWLVPKFPYVYDFIKADL